MKRERLSLQLANLPDFRIGWSKKNPSEGWSRSRRISSTPPEGSLETRSLKTGFSVRRIRVHTAKEPTPNKVEVSQLHKNTNASHDWRSLRSPHTLSHEESGDLKNPPALIYAGRKGVLVRSVIQTINDALSHCLVKSL